MNLLTKLFVLTLSWTAIGQAHADAYQATFFGRIANVNPAAEYPKPFQGLYESFDITVRMNFDDSTALLFASGTCCEVTGYAANSLSVSIAGIETEGWQFGTNADSFFNGTFDMQGRNLFIGNTGNYGQQSWVSLTNRLTPQASIGFGQIYATNGGGYGFAPNVLIARVGSTYWASGSEYMLIAAIPPVPEPEEASLILGGLILVGALRKPGVHVKFTAHKCRLVSNKFTHWFTQHIGLRLTVYRLAFK